MDDLSILLSDSGMGCHFNDLSINYVFYADNLIVEETLNMAYKRTPICQPDAILFALISNKSVKSQNPPSASLAPLSIFSL